MSRLSSTFSVLAKNKRTALTTFITAGDPSLNISVDALHALVEGGADILELGIPFSDPEAEGPVIQAASERSLAHNTSLRNVLDMVQQFRISNAVTPMVLMGYLNSIGSMGYEAFAREASRAGVDGLIMVNLPPEEAEELRTCLLQVNIDLIFLVAPTSTDERVQIIARASTGFIYYVSLKGTTGATHLDTNSVGENVKRIRQQSKLPIQVGFGIQHPKDAKTIARVADGVVVGSALVRIMGEEGASKESILDGLRTKTAQLRAVLGPEPEPEPAAE